MDVMLYVALSQLPSLFVLIRLITLAAFLGRNAGLSWERRYSLNHCDLLRLKDEEKVKKTRNNVRDALIQCCFELQDERRLF